MNISSKCRRHLQLLERRWLPVRLLIQLQPPKDRTWVIDAVRSFTFPSCCQFIVLVNRKWISNHDRVVNRRQSRKSSSQKWAGKWLTRPASKLTAQICTRRNKSVCLLHACLFSSITKIKRKQWTHEDDDWRRQWLSDCAAVVIEWLEPLENPPRITTMSCATKNLASLAKAGPTIRRVSSTIQIFTYMYHMLVVCSIEMFLTLVKYLREPREFKC